MSASSECSDAALTLAKQASYKNPQLGLIKGSVIPRYLQEYFDLTKSHLRFQAGAKRAKEVSAEKAAVRCGSVVPDEATYRHTS
jgi:hypothetical protein